MNDVWLVHNGNWFEGIMGMYINENEANTLCDDLNSSNNEGIIYYVDKISQTT